MTSNLVLLWLTALPLMGSPGPANLSLAAMGAAFGGRRCLPYLAGIILGSFVVLVLIASGVTALILAKPVLVTTITILAAAYILYLAYRIATAPVASQQTDSAKVHSFNSGLILAAANPKAFAAIGAAYSSHTLLQSSLVLDAIAKLMALTLVIFVVTSVWLLFGSVFASLLNDPKASRIANITFAVMLVGSVLLALL